MSLPVVLILSGMALVLSGLGILLREQLAEPKPMPVYIEPEKPRENWDVFVRLYLPDAEGRLEKIGGYLLKHHADKASAFEDVKARIANPEETDADVKAFLVRYEYPPNVLYAVEAVQASNSYQMVQKYKAPVSAEAPE